MGVTIKLITGDSAESAKFLAQQTGFANHEVCLGSAIDKMSEEKLKLVVIIIMIYN
jgi:magnesium-transporting ATPase (P-type)